MTATESPGPVDPTDSSSEGAAPHGTLRRATTTITIWNLVSRLTGFVRVMATASALGIAVLGDTYQRTNQVSNVLFELLAGGMLFSVLVPSFVDELRLGEREGARSLAGALTLRGVAVMGVLVTAGMVLASPISDLLTASADQSTRQTQADLGAFLLLFILPQLVFYVIGAVASGLLQADHRFAAVSAAPALNNLVVIATMITFRVVHDPARGLHLTTGEKVLLGGGTLLGTVAMTVVPLLALRPAGLGMRLRWRVDHGGLGALARRGLWGAGHVGLNQILVLTTIVLAGEVRGGVIAYQTAFTFFLLPHALLAHPIFTALFPRLARHGSARRRDLFADDLGRGLRSITFLVLPATALMAVVTPPALSVVRFGQFDAAGSRLVALVLSAYLLGLVGYSTFFLMTRASYALDEARLPTLVNLAVTASAVLGMVLIAGQVDGNGVLVGFGVVTSITSIGGAVYLTLAVKRRLGTAVRASASVIRTTVSSAAGAAGGFATVSAIGWDSTPHALLSVVTGGLVVAAVTATVLKLVGSEELPTVAGRVRSLFAKVGIG
ncbi:MAG: hypothetical protein KDB02_00565 [Acidimicrobiales bacterium]|nr:hypothetical protein [Acidimicrobiales bacterium]